MSRRESVFALVRTRNGDDATSKILEISHFGDAGLYTVTKEALPSLLKGASNFAESPNKPAPFHALTFYASKKMFLGDLRAVFVDHRTEAA